MRSLFLFILSVLTLATTAQDPTPPTDLEGEALRDWLRTNWYLPWHNDLGYGAAREAMYGSIDAEGGLIECVYTGFTQPAEEVTFPDPINTEHTVPQSFFNSQTPMRSDIHHLFPTHQQANGDRGSLPYDEVVDSQADEWIIESGGNYSSSSNVPSSNIDAYSEVHHNVAFEPREENKGNIARAVMYFYTMYSGDVEPGLEDISSIANLATLYSWHMSDPPDAEEIERDEEIQAAQGNYNPYVRMPELVGPAWGFTSVVSEYTLPFEVIIFNSQIQIESSEIIERIEVLDMSGRLAKSVLNESEVDMQGLASGGYLIKAVSSSGQMGVKKLCFSHYAD